MEAEASSPSLSGFLASVPPVTKALALGVLPAGFLLQLAVPATKAYLGLVAGRTMSCVWMILTSGFLEDDLITVSPAGGCTTRPAPPCWEDPPRSAAQPQLRPPPADALLPHPASACLPRSAWCLRWGCCLWGASWSRCTPPGPSSTSWSSVWPPRARPPLSP